MKKLHFNTIDEFEQLFKQSNQEITDTVVHSIQKAMHENRSTANVFSISFENSDIAYEISLNKSQWVKALDGCLNYYHEQELHDQAIDTWKLQEAAKVW